MQIAYSFKKAKVFLVLILFNIHFIYSGPVKPKDPILRLAVIGLVHDHVNWILNRQKEDVKIVGIVETDKKAIARYQKRYSLSNELFFDSYESMYKTVKPDAVSAFNPTKEHLDVVRYFAPKRIPIMVEKPMATTYKEAQEMAELSKKFNVPLLVNFETSWYESTYEAKKLLETNSFGSLTKMVFNTGHPGPQEIGCTPEFLDWLTDPILNGGGALTDFGCYGANIATWLLNGETPLRVSCVAKQSKPDRYPKVDDDTTIILDYEKKKVVIQASWNWSHNRKDMQIYGSKGYVNCKNAKDMILMKNEQVGEKKHIPQPISEAKKDPFRLLYELVYKDVILEPYSLYSIENNLIVSKILSLASESSKTQKTQNWK